jgi:hypothetical protein
MKKKVLAAILIAVGVLTGCGNTEPISSPIQTVEAEPIATDIQEVEQPGATEEANENHDGMYRSELTNEWIDESLKDQRPIAVMVDNEKTALPHFGVADADVVYEIMNSTLNDRITRFMVVVKDWDKIEQLGSIRSARPTNFMLAAEWNAVLCHDGGPFFINDWVAKDYSANFSGGFARYSNGKAAEFTEYITYDKYTNTQKGKTYDGLKQRFESSRYTTTYNDYYQGPHFKFADAEVTFADRNDAISAGRDIANFRKQIAAGRQLSRRLYGMYARELFLGGADRDFLEAENYFQMQVASPDRSGDEITEGCCVAAKAARLRGDAVSFFKYTSKVIAGDGCSEICCELGHFYETSGDLEEAVIWYYNAVYETQPVLALRTSGAEPLEGLVRCYDRLGLSEQAASYREELNSRSEE